MYFPAFPDERESPRLPFMIFSALLRSSRPSGLVTAPMLLQSLPRAPMRSRTGSRSGDDERSGLAGVQCPNGKHLWRRNCVWVSSRPHRLAVGVLACAARRDLHLKAEASQPGAVLPSRYWAGEGSWRARVMCGCDLGIAFASARVSIDSG